MYLEDLICASVHRLGCLDNRKLSFQQYVGNDQASTVVIFSKASFPGQQMLVFPLKSLYFDWDQPPTANKNEEVNIIVAIVVPLR